MRTTTDKCLDEITKNEGDPDEVITCVNEVLS